MNTVRHRSSLWVGAGLVVLGLVGLVVVLALAGGAGLGGSGGAGFSSLGERLFQTGTDANGNPVPRSQTATFGMMSTGGGCAGCHGTDARGRTVSSMMASFTAPDIRWSTLTATHDPQGQPQTPYDETSFARAVRDGTDPEGRPLHAPMPRWQLTDQEVSALIAYLKTL